MKRDDKSEMMRLIRQISNHRPTHQGVEQLAAYGTACVEPLITEAKHVGGDSLMARGDVINLIGTPAFPILYNLLYNFDREIQLAAASGLGSLNYRGHADLHRRAIDAMRNVRALELDQSIRKKLEQVLAHLEWLWDEYQTEPRNWYWG